MVGWSCPRKLFLELRRGIQMTQILLSDAIQQLRDQLREAL